MAYETTESDITDYSLSERFTEDEDAPMETVETDTSGTTSSPASSSQDKASLATKSKEWNELTDQERILELQTILKEILNREILPTEYCDVPNNALPKTYRMNDEIEELMDEYGPILQGCMRRIEEVFGRIAFEPPARGQKHYLKLYTFHEKAEKFDRECRYYSQATNVARLEQEYQGFAAYLEWYFEDLITTEVRRVLKDRHHPENLFSSPVGNFMVVNAEIKITTLKDSVGQDVRTKQSGHLGLSMFKKGESFNSTHISEALLAQLLPATFHLSIAKNADNYTLDDLDRHFISIEEECKRLAKKFGSEIFSSPISDPQILLGAIGARCINAVEKFEDQEKGWTVQALHKWTMCTVKDFRRFIDNYEEILLTESSGKQPPFCGCESCFRMPNKQPVQDSGDAAIKREKEETRDEEVQSNEQNKSTTKDELHCINTSQPCRSCDQRNMLTPGQKWRTKFLKPLFENEQLSSSHRHKRASSMLYICEDNVKTFRSGPMNLPTHLDFVNKGHKMKNIDGSVAFHKNNSLVYRYVIDLKPDYSRGLFSRDPVSDTMVLNKPAKIPTTVTNKPAKTASKTVKRKSTSMASTSKKESSERRPVLLEPVTISSSDKLDVDKSFGRCQACRKRRKKCDGCRPCQYCRNKDGDCVDEEDRPGKRRRLGS